MNALSHPVAGNPSLNLRHQFARNLRLWRHERALSQAQLAQAAGLSRPFVSSIERGHFSVTLETLDMLAGALGVEPTMLVGNLSFSERRMALRDLRQSKGLSQSQLAAVSGLSRFHIARLETGKSTAGTKARTALARALGVPASSF